MLNRGIVCKKLLLAKGKATRIFLFTTAMPILFTLISAEKSLVGLQGQVVVVSLVEQTMRVYQNGQLVRAFSITTGRSELPSTPGIWQELYRSSPATLVSAFPRNSPYWFPRTSVNYAMLYHPGGHYIVDVRWRATYGPGTQFPHSDAGGNAFANNGTNGGIDMAEQDTMWLYTHTSLKTTIVIY